MNSPNLCDLRNKSKMCRELALYKIYTQQIQDVKEELDEKLQQNFKYKSNNIEDILKDNNVSLYQPPGTIFSDFVNAKDYEKIMDNNDWKYAESDDIIVTQENEIFIIVNKEIQFYCNELAEYFGEKQGAVCPVEVNWDTLLTPIRQYNMKTGEEISLNNEYEYIFKKACDVPSLVRIPYGSEDFEQFNEREYEWMLGVDDVNKYLGKQLNKMNKHGEYKTMLYNMIYHLQRIYRKIFNLAHYHHIQIILASFGMDVIDIIDIICAYTFDIGSPVLFDFDYGFSNGSYNVSDGIIPVEEQVNLFIEKINQLYQILIKIPALTKIIEKMELPKICSWFFFKFGKPYFYFSGVYYAGIQVEIDGPGSLEMYDQVQLFQLKKSFCKAHPQLEGTWELLKNNFQYVVTGI